LAIKQRFGKNAILRGLNFEEGATAKERNEQIGGHRAGYAHNEKGEMKHEK
jgi:DNA polymerase V